MKPFQVSISKLLIFQQHISFRSTRDFPTAWMKPDAGLVSGMCLRNSHGDYFFRLKHISWRSMDPHQHLKQKVQLCWMLLFGSDIWICSNHIVDCLANDSTNFTELGSILLYQSQNVVVYFINSFIYSRKVLSNPLSEQKWCIF